MHDNRSTDRRINMLKNLIAKLSPVEALPNNTLLQAAQKTLPVNCISTFTEREIAGVVSFLKCIGDCGEDLGLSFDQSSGALLWKNGFLEVAKPGFLSALNRIASKEI